MPRHSHVVAGPCRLYSVLASVTLAVMVCFATLLVAADQSTSVPPEQRKPAAAAVATQMQLFPLAFEHNQGQADPQASYVARGAGYSLLLGPGSTVLNVGSRRTPEQLRLRLVNSDRAAQIVGSDPLPTKINYLIGNDRSQWHTNISTFGKVRYQRIYPGIDLVFYGNQGQLEHDFVLAPGANPKRIAFDIAGAKQVSIDDQGNLRLVVSDGEVRLLRPIAYQMVAGHKREIASRFRLRGNRVSFEVARYDHRSALVIDPVLNWSTYLSGTSSSTAAKAVAADATNGVLYVAGNTTAATALGSITAGNVTAPTNEKIFIAKITDSAAVSGSTLAWLTFLGGTGNDTANAIALDATNVYVAGQTSSTNTGGGNGDFPVSANTFETTGMVKNSTTAGCVAGIDQATGGTLAYGSYVGENAAGGNAAATGIVIHGGSDISNGADLYVAGWTTAGGGLLANNINAYRNSFAGAEDGFLLQLAPGKNGNANFPTGELIYGTYVRAAGASGGDSVIVNALGVDSTPLPDWQASSSYNVGDTIMPTSNNAGNYVYQVSAVGSGGGTSGSSAPVFPQTVGNTVQEGSSNTKVTWMNVGSAFGNIYVAGTASGHMPTTGATCTAQTLNSTAEGFVIKFDMSMGTCSALGTGTAGYVRTFGGDNSSTTSVNAMALDSASPATVYVTGNTTSGSSSLHTSTVSGLATSLRDTSCAGCGDAFVGKLGTNGSITWSGYLGGDKADTGLGIALDSANNVVVTGNTQSGQTGQGATNAFPLSNALANVSSLNDGQAGFVAILDSTPALNLSTYLQGSAAQITATIANTSLTSNVASYTYTGATSPLQVGMFVTITGVTLNNGAVYNTSGTITSVAAGVFQIALTHPNIASAANNGTATVTFSDSGNAVAVIPTPNPAGVIAYVAGETTSTSFPSNSVAFQTAPASGASDSAFVNKLAFINTAATMTLSGVSDVPNLGFNTTAGYAGTINYTFTITPGANPGDYVTFDAQVPTNNGSALFNITTVTPSVGTCKMTAAAGVTCQIGTVNAAQTVQIAATATSAAECNTGSACTSIPATFNATAAAAQIGDNASAAVSTPALPVTDLQLTNLGSANPVQAGGSDTVTYTLMAKNAGANDAAASSVTITDILPVDFVVDYASSTIPAGWSCPNPGAPVLGSAATLTCTNTATFAASGTATFAVVGAFAANTNLGGTGSGARTNHATIASTSTTDNVTANNTPADVITTVQRMATITLAAVSNPASGSTVNVDATVTYTLSLSSASGAGNVQVTGAVLNSNLPAGFHATSATVQNVVGTPVTSSCDTATGSGCTSVTINPGDSFDYVITGTYPSTDTNALAATAKTATKTLTATVQADVMPAVTNPGAVTLTLQRSALLTLAASGPAAAVNLADNTVTYKFTVTSSNTSANIATGVVVTPNLPPGFVAASVSINGTPTGAATDASSCTLANLNGTTNVCTGAVVDIGGSFEVDVTGAFPDDNTVITNATVASQLQHNATAPAITAGVVDATTNPAGTALDTTVQRSATLALAIAPSSTTVNLDQTMTYTVKLTSNAGSATSATNAAIVVGAANLPAGFHPTGASATVMTAGNGTGHVASSTGTCDTTTAVTGCTGAVVAPGGEIDYVISGTYPSSDTNAVGTNAASMSGKTITASGSAAVVDNAGAITPATDMTVTVQRSATLTLTVAGDKNTVNLDTGAVPAPITYTVTVSSGPACPGAGCSANTAMNVNLANTVPAGLVVTGVVVTPSGGANAGTCDTTATATGCTGATIPPAGAIAYAITGNYPDGTTVVPSNQASVTRSDTASVTALIVDATPSNISNTPATTVQRSAALSLTAANDAPLVSLVPTINLGGTVHYTLMLSNAGPDTATNVALSNLLPGGMLCGATSNSSCFVITGISVTDGTNPLPNANMLCDTTGGTGCAGAGGGDTTISIAPSGKIVYTVTGTYTDFAPNASVVANNQPKITGLQTNASSTASVNPTAPTNQKDAALTVQRSATLNLTVTGSAPTVNLHTAATPAPITYTVTLSSSNTSADIATNVNLSNTIPSGLVVTSVTPATAGGATQGTCDTTATATGCTGAALPPGGSISYTVNGNYPDGTTVVPANAATVTRTDKATATASIIDTTPSNIVNSPSTTVQRASDLLLGALSATSGAIPLNAFAGQPGPMLITVPVQNSGPDTSLSTVVNLTMHTNGYTPLNGPTTGTTAGWSCSGGKLTGSTQITCTIGSLGVTGTPSNFVLAVQPDGGEIGITANPPTATILNSPSATISSFDSGTSQPDIVETNAGNNTPPPVGSYSLQRQSDLTFGTFADKGTVPLGGTLTLSTQVKTLGPDPAYGVVVSYDLHATGFTVSGTQSGAYWPGGCTFDVTGEFLTCLMSTNSQTQLAVGAPQTFEVAVQVPNTIAPSAGQSSATISTMGTISTSSNCCSVDTEVKNGTDTASLNSTVARIGDLAVTALSNTSSAGNPTALAGPIHITAAVTNNKVTVNSTPVGNDATNVKVVLQLPSPNYTLVANSWTGAFSNCVQGQDAQGNTVSNAFVTCSIALVPTTQTVNGVVDITPDPNAVAVSGNTAQVSIIATVSSAEVLDPSNTTNNNAKTDPNVFLARKSDLQITAAADTSSTTPVPLSGTVSLQTTIFNNGPDAAPGQALAGSAGVSVIYSLSLSGFSFVSSSNPALYGCSQTNSTTITCQLTNTLASGTSQTYTINLKPPANPTFSAPPNSALVTTTITGRATDAYDDGVGGVAGANNTLSANSTIARVADLRVIAATDNSPVGTAGPLTFFTTLQDVGPDDATNVQAVYVLPASWTTASVTTPSVVTATPYSNCTIQATTPLQLVCTVGSLQLSDGQKTFQASVTPDPNSPSSVTTSAEVQSTSVYDNGTNGAPNFTGDNKLNFNTSLVHVINLSISSFTGNPAKGTFTALGSANPVTYTITVSNAAKTSGGAFTSPAAGVFLTLDVPASFTKVSTSGTGWDCSTFPVCNYTQNLGTFSSSGSPGSTTLTVTGYYNDDPTLNLAASQGFLAGQAPVMFGATAGSTDNSAVQDSGNPFVEQKVETDIQRLVSVNVSTITPSVTTTPLNSTVSYDVKVANAAGMNQATQLKVNVQLPSNFINGALDAGNSTAGWTCGTFTAGSTVTCTQSSALAGGTTFDLVFTGQYDDASTNLTNSNMPGQGTATVTATPLVTQAVEKNLTDLAPVSQGITLERLVHLSVAQSNGLLGNPTNLANSVTNQILVSNAATTTVNAQQVATNSAVAVKVSWGIDPTAQTVFNVNPTATNTNSPGWTCTYPTGSATTVSPVVCTYSATIASGASAAPLNIIGQYSDLITDTHITGGMAAVAAVATLDLQNADFDPSFTATWNTSTNIQRSVQLSIQQQTATMEPVSLGTQIGYAVAVGNAGGLNTADSIAVTFNLPSGFTYANKFSSPNGDWTNCVLNGSALTCTLDSLQSGRTSDAVTIFGSYSTGLNLSMAGQTQLTVAGNLATSASLDSGSPTVKAFSVTSTVQRAVDLTAAAIPAPGVVGGAAVLGAAGGDPAANTVTYTVTVKNTSGLDASGGSTADPNAVEMTFAVDAVNGDPTVLGPLAPHFKTTSVLVSGNTVAVTCDSITKPGQVFCNYQNQPANSTTTFTISGQFDGSVVLTGSALANAAAKVVSTDSYDVSLTNNSGTTQVAVVDTPASGITNQHPTVLYTTTAPLSLRYDSVTTAGITTLAMSNTAPANFVQPSNSPVDYTSVVAPYFSAATDATYPVAANGLVTACVNINPAGFANPERVRIFDQKGTDITNALALSGTPAVCGATPVAALAPGSPLGFTVREPVLHKPTAQMVTPTQVLTGGSHGGTSNLFTISAGGTVDPDFGQICNGTPSGSGAAQFCGDTLTYVFKGPVGMGINQAGSWSPDFSTLTVVVPAVNGAQGTPPSFTGTFPVGVSAVNLTVTDQTGQSSSASVNVALNSFTLGGSSVTSATILAGQSTSFTFSPTVLINGIQLPASFGGDMTLTCDGSRDSDHSSLAANHMACTMSPSTITQGQSSQVLITTTGPNFSRLRPAAPGSQSRELVAVLAITLFPAFGFVLLPKRRSRKGLLLLILLIAAMAIFMVGCGGGATVQPPAQNIQAQTPAGTYTITVTGTATGGVVSTSTFTVTVH